LTVAVLLSPPKIQAAKLRWEMLPVYVADQMGHADAGGLSMSVHTRALRRRERLTGATLGEYDKALQMGRNGQNFARAGGPTDRSEDPGRLETAS
jgi:hypothetical protein